MFINTVHPGLLLAEEMTARGLNPNSLALKIRSSRQAISEIVAGQRAISPVMALRLGRYLGTGAEIWTNMQAAYDLAQAEREFGEVIAREVEAAA